MTPSTTPPAAVLMLQACGGGQENPGTEESITEDPVTEDTEENLCLAEEAKDGIKV